ncbi:hypothetical protein [Fredinandcohnia quinoae]|uniref:Uncharacterized protein n=1 Tax=Fredinandcohnia quinoae TaxID=2918902 RepID=A0AAW5E886_9BACI|nr:hypothetical protein [Fredinandcohnia sp. SECRCQ15]MCH1627704.1 hypothetical protein [Fredinandcohnia sp. SECRCQ15]
MDNIDKRNRLDEAPFNYRVTKNNAVFLDYFGKQVKILKGKEAVQFLKKVNAAENEKAIQLIMAKITGNFKRGNERNHNSGSF